MSKPKSVGTIILESTPQSDISECLESSAVSILGDALNASPQSSYVENSGHLVQIRNNGTKRVSLSFEGDEGCTVQSHAPFCDIQTIIDSHLRLGGIPPIPESGFMDLTNIPDYQTALNTVNSINSLFENLPLNVKKHFDQNPALLMQAMEDPSQRDTLIELGVLSPKNPPLREDLKLQGTNLDDKSAEGGVKSST